MPFIFFINDIFLRMLVYYYKRIRVLGIRDYTFKTNDIYESSVVSLAYTPLQFLWIRDFIVIFILYFFLFYPCTRYLNGLSCVFVLSCLNAFSERDLQYTHTSIQSIVLFWCAFVSFRKILSFSSAFFFPAYARCHYTSLSARNERWKRQT